MKNKVHIRIIGKDVLYFLRLLIRKEILLISVDIKEKELDLIVSEEDYLKIKKMKTTYQVIVINIIGKKKIIALITQYKLLLFSMFIGLIMIHLLSNLIFEIEVIHPKKEIKEIVYKNLEDLGIKRFRFKVGYQEKEEIVKKILERETERIEWLEIERKGTKYIVRVEERKKNPKIEKKSLQHVIATKDAMILSIYAETGEIVVKEYDYVKKGDILISGLIHNKEEIKEKVSAQGIVYGEVWYQVRVELSVNHKEEKLTGNSSKCLSFQLLNKTKCILPFNNYKHYSENKKNIFKNRIIPFELNLSTRQEKIINEEKLTRKTGEQKALKYALEKLNSELKEGDLIISKKTLKINIKDSKIVVDVFFKVKENITGFLNIEHIDIEAENQRMMD